MHDIPVIYDIVPLDVPALFGLDALYAHGLFVDNINNLLVNTRRTWDIDGTTQHNDN